MKEKYLKVTIYDNDFTSSLVRVCKILYNIFQDEDKYPEEKDFPFLKTAIQYMWCGTKMAQDISRWGNINTSSFNYLIPDLEIVDAHEIEEWENYESVYIPLFDDGSLVVR